MCGVRKQDVWGVVVVVDRHVTVSTPRACKGACHAGNSLFGEAARTAIIL